MDSLEFTGAEGSIHPSLVPLEPEAASTELWTLVCELGMKAVALPATKRENAIESFILNYGNVKLFKAPTSNK
jgi:hypothetical protein